MIVGSDLQVVHDHFSNDSVSAGTAHGATGGVVGRTNTQTLTNKTLTSPVITSPAITGGTINSGAALTVDSTELNYVDGVTSAIQTQLNTIVNTTIPASTPVGTIVMYGGTAAPTGWLLCNGQSTASYTALAALVGANVPDLMGRAPIGYGSGTGLTARSTIGAKVGAEEVTLTEAQMPGHTHAYGFGGGTTGGAYITQASPSGTFANSTTTGSGAAHPNMQPSTVVNFIIKH
jgi:microcystin-dependent protein